MIKEKIKSIRKIAVIRAGSKKVYGLCQGNYDLLHPGHIKHLEQAKSFCDKLIVIINDDQRVMKRKGAGRPIFNQRERAYMIASLCVVDMVAITPYKTAKEAIITIRPDMYIKGKDYKEKNTKGIKKERKAIRSVGGIMVYTNTEKESTTKIIERIKNG